MPAVLSTARAPADGDIPTVRQGDAHNWGRRKKAKHVMITIWQWRHKGTPGDLPFGIDPSHLRNGTKLWIVWQKELVDGGSHLQVCANCEARDGWDLPMWKAQFEKMGAIGPHINVRYARSNHKKCLEYVTKNETRQDGPWIYRDGTPVHRIVDAEEAERIYDTIWSGDSFTGGSLDAQGRSGGGQGARTDIALLTEWLDSMTEDAEGVDYVRVCGECSNDQFQMVAQYHTAIKGRLQYHARKRAKRIRNVGVHVLVGEPACGKTYHVISSHPDCYIWKPSITTKWFDGYMGQSVMLIDEFSGQVGIEQMLGLLDRYMHQVEIKTSSTYINVDTIYITSNVEPSDWYINVLTGADELRPIHRRALHSRLTTVKRCTRTENPPGVEPRYAYQRMDISATIDPPINNRS